MIKYGNFEYFSLEKILNCTILEKKIDIHLLISLERNYYNKDYFFKLCKNIKQNLLNQKNFIKIEADIIFVDSFDLNLGSTLNRHNWYYRYCEKYMSNENLTEEEQIPNNIREEFSQRAYQKGKKQGKEWITNNIKAINQLIPEDHKLNKNFQINDSITTLYEGNSENTKIRCIDYDYWLNHPRYKMVYDNLKKACKLKNSIIDRAFKFESNFFYKRFNKVKNIKYKNLFEEQSYKYLFDETVSYIIKNYEKNNILEFYYNGKETVTEAFRGRKAQNDPIIKKLMEKGQPLEGADQRKFVSVKMVEEEE